jgi:translation initiation factor IF-2
MLKTRPPIITVLGHVDHGKTTLLDYLRKTKVQASEAGGITQHIGAYQIKYEDKPITFIDTPGHAAFNEMRQRGAQITDIVILVISAKDGVQPQTVESIKYIKEADVPCIVAINKIDLAGADPTAVKTQLTENEMVVQEYGGDVDTVEISALKGKGIDELLENVLTLAELLELKADDEVPLKAVVIESTKDQHKGPIARVIVQEGTLRLKQELIVDGIKGRVKSLVNESGQQLQTVQPGEPAEILGLNDVPEVGSIIKEANVEYPKEKELDEKQESEKSSWDDIDVDLLLGDKEKLNLIVKADVKGTLEAITQALDEETIELVDASVGLLTEGDLEMAQATNSVIVVFGQKIPAKLKKMAKLMQVPVKQYDVIYHLLEDLEEQMLKLMDPHYGEVELGRAEILQVFDFDGRKIAGIRIITGEINRHDKLYLKRDDKIIARPAITSMKHGKDSIEIVKAKGEAGLAFKNKSLDFKKGDIIVAYKKEV